MGLGLKNWIWTRIVGWLTRDAPPFSPPLCDFERLSYEVRAADVILVEGRSQVSEVIKTITQSPWTHSALYIGRLHDITDPRVRERVLDFYNGAPDEQLVVEALLGKGTVITPLSSYHSDHLRICRPRDLAPPDVQTVINRAIGRLGTDYDVRQLVDLARFLFPYGVLPRRWRSSLFQHNAGRPTRTVCSTMLAEAFQAVQFPILPLMREDVSGHKRLYNRNPRLFSPKDFDYSPYFDIIKYPVWSLDEPSLYRQLPWNEAELTHNDEQQGLKGKRRPKRAGHKDPVTAASLDTPTG